jgi:hypothetical protein
MAEPPFNGVNAEIGCDAGGVGVGGVRVGIGGSGVLQLAHASATRRT